MKTLALLFLAARLAHAAPPPLPDPAPDAAASSTAPVRNSSLSARNVDSARIKLDAQDAAGALADAEAAVAAGGGADAYAARADSKRALGYAADDVISDYARAAELDPRYMAKYKGLIVQRDSEAGRTPVPGAGAVTFPNWANVFSNIIAFVLLGGIILVVAMTLIRGRDDPAAPREPDDPGDERPPKDGPPRNS